MIGTSSGGIATVRALPVQLHSHRSGHQLVQGWGKIIVTWDESDTDNSGINGGGGGHVPTIVVSSALKANPQQYGGGVDTTGLLHSIEDNYGLAHLGGSSSDETIDALLSRS
jgi:hypothetical protein